MTFNLMYEHLGGKKLQLREINVALKAKVSVKPDPLELATQITMPTDRSMYSKPLFMTDDDRYVRDEMIKKQKQKAKARRQRHNGAGAFEPTEAVYSTEQPTQGGRDSKFVEWWKPGWQERYR
jgi:hypothetical protein